MLKRSENPAGPFTLIDSINSSESIIEYTDENVDAASRPYYYTIAAINFCDEEITTSENIAGTIFLSGQAEGNRVNIEWTPYHEWTTGISEYDVERSLSGGAFEVINETNTTSYTDDSFNELIGQDVNSEVCYRITAYEAPGSPHSSGQASSSSNILCVSLPMNLRFDYNAFVPGLEGYSEFGPVMDFLPGYFRFEIYNRAGTKVYESSDPYNPTWDGRYDRGDIVTEGVYRYQLEYEDENGKRVVLNGNVSVVRK